MNIQDFTRAEMDRVFELLRLVTDPVVLKKKLEELQAAKRAADDAIAEVARRQDAFDRAKTEMREALARHGVP